LAGQQTPATLAVTRAGVSHTLHAYEHARDDFARDAVQALGLDPRRVLKTLVVVADGQLAVCCVPADSELDLKAVAAALEVRKATMADPHAAERATGYVVGGISPLGQKRRLPTLVDESALAHDTVHVSAGRRGLELELAPAELVRLTRARTAPIARRRA
jgi:Cys-tRNA(Pro)/Cys-tRNA(Cys) deacylase